MDCAALFLSLLCSSTRSFTASLLEGVLLLAFADAGGVDALFFTASLPEEPLQKNTRAACQSA
jgi:hypothetical protein